MKLILSWFLCKFLDKDIKLLPVMSQFEFPVIGSKISIFGSMSNTSIIYLHIYNIPNLQHDLNDIFILPCLQNINLAMILISTVKALFNAPGI